MLVNSDAYVGLALPGKAGSGFLSDYKYNLSITATPGGIIEMGSLIYFLCKALHLHGSVSGYCSVLRTFLSAFIASYEVNLWPEDNNPILILDILCKIYRGEFWDKGSYIDGPIWCLLCNLENEFPFQTVKLVQLLSSLCEGAWPAECVYNFLDKSVGVLTLFEISNDSLLDGSHIVEARQPVCVHGIKGLFIPVETRGHVLKAIGENTALVRWEVSFQMALF
ncbi:nucleoporin NUP188-like protein [Senna tora]|uniref:Nucleoporin NUP188-like protein n=1 Tax=Senna tora TaxID=362788 RepID=A0A834WUL3_9FABA|nr:nucleoporin NUP188-like protein [Senna tora]